MKKENHHMIDKYCILTVCFSNLHFYNDNQRLHKYIRAFWKVLTLNILDTSTCIADC